MDGALSRHLILKIHLSPTTYHEKQIKLKNKLEFRIIFKDDEFLGVGSQHNSTDKNGQSYQSIFDHFKSKHGRKIIKR